MVLDKDPEDMNNSELKEELKKLYKKINDLDDRQMESLDFGLTMKVQKKNKSDEVVEEYEKEI